MSCMSLLFLALLAQAPAADPFDLIPQLGSARYAERQAASSALERLGRQALPALRTALEQKDPEIRTRASALLVRIEGSLLTQPSLATLDFQNAPLTDVVRSLSEQTGIKLTLFPENSPSLLGRKVTVHEAGPLPFWKAIDRLCDAGHLQYNFGMHAFPNGNEATFPLFEGGVRPTAPVSDSGPFRVCVMGLHYQRDVNFPPAPRFNNNKNDPEAGPGRRPSGVVNEQFFAQIQVAGEPRLSLLQNGPLRITEAVDGNNNALVAPSNAEADVRRSGYFGFATGSVIQVQAPLVRPARPGTTIKKLKGVVPVQVSTRKPNPLVVTLAGSKGRAFRNSEVVLTLLDVQTQAANRPQAIELTIRPNTGGPDSGAGADRREGSGGRPDSHQQQLEVTDAQGRSIPWYQSSYDADSGRIVVNLANPDRAASAAELRYYNLASTPTEVPFEFSELPMP